MKNGSSLGWEIWWDYKYFKATGLTNFDPNTWALLIPEEQTNRFANEKRDETIPEEEVQHEGDNNTDTCNKKKTVDHF